MADPFTIAVSVAGLAGFGVQLIQVLNQYAGSATDSKGRIRAISNDIHLTIEVLTVFKNNLDDEAHRQCMSDGAEKIAKDAIQICEDIFTKIDKLVQGAGGKPAAPHGSNTPASSGQFEPTVSFFQKLKWPLVEPKLDILRGNLEKVKTTLQLLMSVITFAVMSKMHSDQGSIDRQKAEIERLKLEKIEADNKLKVLLQSYPDLDDDGSASCQTLSLPERQWTGQCVPPSLPSVERSVSNRPRSIDPPSSHLGPQAFDNFNLALASTPVHTIPVFQPADPKCVAPPEIQGANAQDQTLPHRTQPPDLSHLRIEMEATKSGPESTSLGNPHMDALHADYIACIQQLNALQLTLEDALKKLFLTSSKGNEKIKHPDPDLAWSERFEAHKAVRKTAQGTINVLEKRLICTPTNAALRDSVNSELTLTQEHRYARTSKVVSTNRCKDIGGSLSVRRISQRSLNGVSDHLPTHQGSMDSSNTDTSLELTKTGRIKRARKGKKVYKRFKCRKIYSRNDHLQRHMATHEPSQHIAPLEATAGYDNDFGAMDDPIPQEQPYQTQTGMYPRSAPPAAYEGQVPNIDMHSQYDIQLPEMYGQGQELTDVSMSGDATEQSREGEALNERRTSQDRETLVSQGTHVPPMEPTEPNQEKDVANERYTSELAIYNEEDEDDDYDDSTDDDGGLQMVRPRPVPESAKPSFGSTSTFTTERLKHETGSSGFSPMPTVDDLLHEWTNLSHSPSVF